MTRTREQELQFTAYHEAGHAVAAILFEIPFQRVSIVPEADSLGHVMFRKYSKAFSAGLSELSDRYPAARLRDRAERRAMTMLAGQVAERVTRRRSNRLGARSDYHNAMDLCGALWRGSSNETLSQYIDWLQHRVGDSFSSPNVRNGIRALAKRLLVEREMTSERAREIWFSAHKQFVRRKMRQQRRSTQASARS